MPESLFFFIEHLWWLPPYCQEHLRIATSRIGLFLNEGLNLFSSYDVRVISGWLFSFFVNNNLNKATHHSIHDENLFTKNVTPKPRQLYLSIKLY